MKFKHEKAFRFGVYILKTRFYEKIENNFLNSEQKIIFAEKRVNNFVNNAKQKIILCKMLETVYAETVTIFMRKQWIVLINTENRFYECSK